MTPKAATIAVAAIAFFTCSCSSRPISVGAPKSYECDASTRSVTEDEATPYGFSVADVLPLISGRLDGTLTWNSSPDVQVSPSGTTTLHLELVPRLDEVTLESGCGTYLYLPTDMSLSTDDGGLAEHRDATFQVTSKEKLRVILLLYSAGSGWAPAGSLRVAYEGPSVWDVESLTMDISITSSGTQGNIEYSAYINPPGNATTSISATVATWVPKATSDAGPD